MKTRQLLRTDLPKFNESYSSLHIPVLYENKERFVADIHFSDPTLCYLENGEGIPVKISDLLLIIK